MRCDCGFHMILKCFVHKIKCISIDGCGEALGPCIELMSAHCSLVLVNLLYLACSLHMKNKDY